MSPWSHDIVARWRRGARLRRLFPPGLGWRRRDAQHRAGDHAIGVAAGRRDPAVHQREVEAETPGLNNDQFLEGFEGDLYRRDRGRSPLPALGRQQALGVGGVNAPQGAHRHRTRGDRDRARLVGPHRRSGPQARAAGPAPQAWSSVLRSSAVRSSWSAVRSWSATWWSGWSSSAAAVVDGVVVGPGVVVVGPRWLGSSDRRGWPRPDPPRTATAARAWRGPARSSDRWASTGGAAVALVHSRCSRCPGPRRQPPAITRSVSISAAPAPWARKEPVHIVDAEQRRTRAGVQVLWLQVTDRADHALRRRRSWRAAPAGVSRPPGPPA